MMDFDAQPEPARGPTMAEQNRMRRSGAMFREARTLTDHYRADREQADNRNGRKAVWRAYVLALMIELHRRGDPRYLKVKRYRSDNLLPIITRDQHEWEPGDGPVTWTLWSGRPDAELDELHEALYQTLARTPDNLRPNAPSTQPE